MEPREFTIAVRVSGPDAFVAIESFTVTATNTYDASKLALAEAHRKHGATDCPTRFYRLT